MRRYWLEKGFIQPPFVHLSGEVFHHVFSVCRQKMGSKFEVLGDENKAHLVEVISVGKSSAEARIIESREIPMLPRPYIHLAISVPKFPTLEAVIEKSVELGVKSITPFFSDYSFVRKSDSIPKNKIERWKKIVVSATQQSGRSDLMEIHETLPLSALQSQLTENPEILAVFAFEGEASQDVKSYLDKNFTGRVNNQLSDVWIIVGSEGGFSESEARELTRAGIQPLTLGEQILRVETACISLVSIVKFQLGLMR